MKNSFGSVVWVTDTEGSGYVCKEKDESQYNTRNEEPPEKELLDCEKIKICESKHSLENLDNIKLTI